MATIDYTENPRCRCGSTNLRHQEHGNKGPHYFNPYILLTCRKCGRKWSMRLGPKKDRDGNAL